LENEEIEFNVELFNPNFWHCIDAMSDLKIRFIWLYGGSSSAKTYSIVQAILYDALYSGPDTIVFRKTDASIEKTVYKDFKTVISTWELEDEFKVLKSPKQIRCVSTGAVIDFAGMDDPEKIKGISQYKRVYCNEISAFEFADFKQIRKRLRGQEGQQVIADFNPVDEMHWIKEDVFDKAEQNHLPVELDNGLVDPLYTRVAEKWTNSKSEIINPKGEKETIPPNMIVIRSTYLNNYWVVGSPCGEFGFYDIQTIADFEQDKQTDYNFYRVYALGEWGKLTEGGEFYKAFRTNDHVEVNEYNKEIPLHISFDENVNPYLSLAIYQAEGERAWQIDEICLKNPYNTLAFTLAEFKRRYPMNKMGLFVYGDRTSLKEDTKLEKGTNFYTIITSTLSEYSPSLRLPSKNPPVAMRGNFINEKILGEGKFAVSDKCKNAITDYLYVKEASDGTKLKEKTKDSVTKVTYEKWGHLSDCSDYFLCQYFNREFLLYQRGGKNVKMVSSNSARRR
jgi:PBSX family phage terminase large subunit